MNGRDLQDYQRMLADDVRMAAYEQAIAEICPGKVVCEIGAGLGPLSLMALKSGAVKVYGIELNEEALQIAVEVIRNNGFDESRFVPIHGLSSRVTLPERVDVILSETLDSMGLGENTAYYMRDAHERFLKPDGCFLPRELSCWVALANPAQYWEKEDFWAEDLYNKYDLNYNTIIPSLRRCKQTIPIHLSEIYSDWYCWQRIRFDHLSTYPKVAYALLQAKRAELGMGMACAFDAVLAPGIEISTFPDRQRTHWEQGFMPFPEKVALKSGDVVYVELELSDMDNPSLNFEIRIANGSIAQIAAIINKDKAA